MILTRLVYLLYSSKLRGRTRITSALAKKFKSLQAIPVEMSDGSILYADLRLTTAHGIFSGSSKEVEEKNIICRVVKPADIVFDIGAHIGFYSILFSRIVGEKGKVYSFEPSSEVSSALALTIDRLANTTLLPFGLSDKESDGFLFIPEDASAASLADWTNESLGKVHKISCQIKRLDDLLANNEVPRPDFIKCDVEGAEELVFRGGLEILDCKDAPIILFEVNEEASKGFNLSKTGAMDFLASLEKADFSFFDARTDALSQISEIPPPLPSALAVNILAVPKAKLNRLSN